MENAASAKKPRNWKKLIVCLVLAATLVTGVIYGGSIKRKDIDIVKNGAAGVVPSQEALV